MMYFNNRIRRTVQVASRQIEAHWLKLLAAWMLVDALLTAALRPDISTATITGVFTIVRVWGYMALAVTVLPLLQYRPPNVDGLSPPPNFWVRFALRFPAQLIAAWFSAALAVFIFDAPELIAITRIGLPIEVTLTIGVLLAIAAYIKAWWLPDVELFFLMLIPALVYIGAVVAASTVQLLPGTAWVVFVVAVVGEFYALLSMQKTRWLRRVISEQQRYYNDAMVNLDQRMVALERSSRE